MRIIIIFLLSLGIYSCTNDISSIGQNLVEEQGGVYLSSYKLTDTYTIRLDSFVTSGGGLRSSTTVTPLMFGKAKDQFTGEITAIPFFQVAPTSYSRLHYSSTYDSITFSCGYSGKIWGDTTQLQTLKVYHTNSLPIFDSHREDDNRYIYNVATLDYSEENLLGSHTFYPYIENLKDLDFRLNDSIGKALFDMIYQNNIIFYYSDPLDFIKYFHDIAIVPDDNNTCLFGIPNVADSLKITIHYHTGTSDAQYILGRSSSYNEYTFNNIVNNPEGTPYSTLKKQTEKLPFTSAKQGDAIYGQAVTQGMNGFMILSRLPIFPANERNQTIVKAELVLEPQENSVTEYKPISSVYIYKANADLTVLTDQITSGTLSYDAAIPEETNYTIDITDYYKTLCNTANAIEENYLIFSINLANEATSYDRLVIDEYPTLNVYYAIYE